MRVIRRNIEPLSIEEGAFYDKDHFTTTIRDDTDFYVNDKLLFSYRRHVIDNDEWLPIAEAHLKKPILTSNNRRMAGEDPRRRVNSGIVGFFDGLTPQMKHKLGLSKAGRPTAFIRKHPREWLIILPLFRQLDKWYKETSPHFYHVQKKAIREVVPALRITNTVFTTATINRNWRTAAHTDKGDFKDALSCIALLGKNVKGGSFGFPQYRVLIEARPGDAILMDPHEAHCNTELDLGENGVRFSLVCYLRQDLRGMTKPILSRDNDVFYIHPT